ncbi:hypothetical protein Aab01nite_44300 [Paractinoplanes abujensis]|uniref:Uncharacterized protein n=1 Tax=Paractinoplanes abujensis TaxID=882441 RepID=A0A7W7FZ20_9ACTN|nr:hypothetical protein [Actinoplanes abujensis]MBB4690067.1 hypothetical protein [Actinoplanes abujensis]GID20840.1 hypothetical protein Aab01nite_44300 [Actinoplanes abujensis]
MGRLSLRLDALYCAVVVAALGLFARPLSETLGLHPAVLLVLALGVALWAFTLHRAAAGPHLRRFPAA